MLTTLSTHSALTVCWSPAFMKKCSPISCRPSSSETLGYFSTSFLAMKGVRYMLELYPFWSHQQRTCTRWQEMSAWIRYASARTIDFWWLAAQMVNWQLSPTRVLSHIPDRQGLSFKIYEFEKNIDPLLPSRSQLGILIKRSQKSYGTQHLRTDQ